MNMENSKNRLENDLNNEEVITKIFETGSDEELKELREFHNLTAEQIELFQSCAKLRKSVIEQMKRDIKTRKEQNPIATAEELSMGAYKESIEPQVREAVLNLRKKGYTTYESGFHMFNGQIISFEKNHLIPEELIGSIKIDGVDIKINPNSISFSYDHFLELDEIKNIWNQIEQSLPDLGKPVTPCSLPQAESFRQQQ